MTNSEKEKVLQELNLLIKKFKPSEYAVNKKQNDEFMAEYTAQHLSRMMYKIILNIMTKERSL